MALQRITISASCPSDPIQCDLCGQRLRQRLRMTQGINDATLHCVNGTGTAEVELDYDARLITLSELEQEVRRAGVLLSDRAQLILSIDGMVSPRSEQAIETALAKLPGVTASASFASHSLRVEFDRRQCAMPEIVRRLDELGRRVRGGSAHPVGEIPAGGLRRDEPPAGWSAGQMFSAIVEYQKLLLALLGGVLLLAAFIVHRANGPQWLRLALIAPSYLLTGWGTFRDTGRSLEHRQLNLDVLSVAAAIGASILGYYEEGGLLLFLFAIGGAGEELAMDRARQAIAPRAKLAPETAPIRTLDGAERLVKIEDLQLHDHVVIR